jgi:hypothetical protein
MRAGRPRSQGMCIAAVCAIRMTVSRDHGGTWFPYAPAPQGSGGTGFPQTPYPREGLGGLCPPRNNLFSSRRCAAAAPQR